MNNLHRNFPIIGISRADLEICGFDAAEVDDAIMERLAAELAEDCFEQIFGESLSVIAENLDIPKIEE